MFRRFAPVLALLIILSLALMACGEEKAAANPDAIPSYNGATVVAVPAALKTQIDGGLKDQVKGAKFDFYKTTDEGTKVKTFFTDNLIKNGWQDMTSTMKLDDLKQMETMGVFALGYQKGTKAVAIVGFPGALTAMMGVDGVGQQDTLYMVISGEK